MKEAIKNKKGNTVIPAGKVKKVRDSNLELYRIVTMLLIIAHHYVVNSGLFEILYADPLASRSLFLFLFGAWGKVGINCFVLMTGYFMCRSEISVRKFVRLVGEVLFYKIIFFFVFFLTGYEPFALKDLIKAFFPITMVEQNFTGCYLLFYLSIPFLNILIRNLNERQHIQLLLLLGGIYIGFGTLPMFPVTMNYVSWYMVLYVIASYIRMYPKSLFGNTKFWGWMSVAALAVSSLSVIACVWVGAWYGEMQPYYFVNDANKLLAVVTAVCSFLFFKNLKVQQSNFINTVAASTFGVLQIHANSDVMRRWLWQDVLNNVGMYGSEWLLIHAVGSVFGVFIVCTGLDYLRIRFVETKLEKLWDDRKR